MAKLFACFKPITDDESDSTTRPDRDFQPENTVPHENREVAYVELLRHSNEPLGLVIEGGADRGTQVHVALLRPGGVAEKSLALQIGDHILSINGTATERLLHAEVNALLQNAGNVINLEISFEASPGADLDDGTIKKTALIALTRERNSYGFTISGGLTENRPITVSNVTVGSTAFRNGTLKVGDRILKVNGVDVSKASQMEMLSLLKTSENTCTLQIEYDVTLHEGLTDTRGALLVELLKPKGVSLGISLSGAPTHGEPIWISHVKEAGIADRCGALHIGDQLLSVNGTSLDNRSINDVVQMLVLSDLHAKLEIIPAHNFTDRPDFTTEDVYSDTMSHISRRPSTHLHSGRQSQVSLASSNATSTHMISHPETMVVQLKADNIGFGLSLQGGAREYTNYPLTIARIEEGGPAARLGRLQVEDRLLAVNGVRMEGVTLQQALKLVQEGDDVIDMEVEFDVTDTIVPTSGTFDVKMVKTASLNLGITINGTHQHGDPIWISNLKKGGIAYRMGMLQPGDVLLAINEQSLDNATLRDAANLLKDAGDVVTLKVSKDNANIAVSRRPETVIYSVELHRHGQSLGISLTGSKHQPGHPVVISNIKEGGVAHKTGTIKAGDRILAIGGESLFGKTVPEAVSMLQSAGDVVLLKISKASRKQRLRSKPGSPTGKSYRYGGRDFGPLSRARNRDTPTSNHSHLTRVSSFGSSYYVPSVSGMRVRRLSAITLATSASGRSTPETHQMANLDREHSILSLRHQTQDLLSERGASERPGSAFTRPSSIGVPPHRKYHNLDGYTTQFGSSMRTRQNDQQKRGSFTETDEEMSLEEEEMSHLRLRRSSVPVYSQFGGNRSHEKRWDFKPRRASYSSQRIPVGRVSPLTPSITDSVKPSTDPPFPKLGMTARLASGVASPVAKPLTETQEHPENAAKAGSNLKLSAEVAPSTPAATIAGGEQTDGACLKDFEVTLFKSSKFIEQMKHLAESGSSDQDSDTEPLAALKGEVPPHLQGKLLQQMQSAMIPTQTIPFTIKLIREGSSDFGFSLSDGLYEPGVYVKSIRPGGPADQNGELRRYDRLLKVNGTIVNNYDCCKMVPLLDQIGEEVTLIIARNPLAAGEGRNV